ncbi:hypothetical protein SLEP1_g49452 [Rubroshorea leprosula]|uniref:Uncharacterized protein n=1 Tax=Rubroshorea leprosula TaxID=152421 RepID=A0AAV5LWU4_9ROSI|nr:hypothetical protein SLEP1_g49452 [Rubroshorea leprosula]
MIFPYFLVQEPDLEPKNPSPHLQNFGSALLCSSPSGCSCFLTAGLFPPAAPVSTTGELWFLIVLSVSIEIECSILCE